MKERSDIMWVSGGISYHGVVTGRACMLEGHTQEEACHTDEDKAGTTWRWDVNDQMFMAQFIPQKRNLTVDETFAVEDWLVKHGYKEED